MKKVHFGVYSLDPVAARLLKHDEILALPPKALAFLAYLLERRGQLVTKAELLDKVWGHRFVSQGVLKNTVTLLRQTLGDDPKTPLYIETVHRLGYRFIADTLPPQSAVRADLGCHCGETIPLVGRGEPLAELRRMLDQAAIDQPRLAFVSGEAGVGKTAVIETFVRAASVSAACGRGYCFEQYGPGEPYMPVLEALNELIREESDRFLELMRQVAPTWLVQLPWYREKLWPNAQQTVMAASPLRMARELGEFLARSAEEKPLILVLEDLHWSDQATLDLLAYLARRRQPERWMIVASYRPEDLLAGHPLKSVQRELTIQGLCSNHPLQPLSGAAVKEYLVRRFPGRRIEDAWLRKLYDKTGGLPYFLVSWVESLPSGHFMAGSEDQGGLSGTPPEGVTLLLSRQFERLPDGCRRVLEVASVVGMSFSTETVAAALNENDAEVGNCLEELAGMRQFIEVEEDSSTMVYRFRYAFRREFVLGRLSPAQRRQLNAIEEGYALVPGKRGNLVLGRIFAVEYVKDHPKTSHYAQPVTASHVRRSQVQQISMRRGVSTANK